MLQSTQCTDDDEPAGLTWKWYLALPLSTYERGSNPRFVLTFGETATPAESFGRLPHSNFIINTLLRSESLPPSLVAFGESYLRAVIGRCL